jgi:hypothetical protein
MARYALLAALIWFPLAVPGPAAAQFDPLESLVDAVQPPDTASPSNRPDPPEALSGMPDLSESGGVTFYFQAEALFWHRLNLWKNQPLVVDNTTQAPVVSTSNLNLSPHTAPRFTIGYALGPTVTCEGIYFGLFDWTDSKTSGPGTVGLPLPLQGALANFGVADNIDLVYSSRLNNAEAHLVFEADYFRWLAGFRYVELTEYFNLRATSAEFGGTSDYGINTSNHLYGGQLGARWSGGASFWGWQSDLKAGILGNCGLEHQILREQNNTVVLRDSTATLCNLAALAEFNFSFTIQITPVWTAMIGYNVLWIEGLALAPDQVDFSLAAPGGTFLRNDAGILLHGANVGLVAAW